MEAPQAARAHHRAGPRLSPRQRRRHAHADVPPGRGPCRGQRHHHRRPQGHAQRRSRAAASTGDHGSASARASSPTPSPAPRSTSSVRRCKGAGCAHVQGTGWIEILGCGMVHPVGVRGRGLRPRSAGPASRSASASSASPCSATGIDDIRLFYENDAPLPASRCRDEAARHLDAGVRRHAGRPEGGGRAPRGLRIRGRLDRGGDVIDFEVTANRPDCLSVYGLAREAATAFDRRPQAARRDVTDPKGHATIKVSIGDAGCGRYAAAVADVRVGPSPDWLAAPARRRASAPSTTWWTSPTT